MRGCGSALALPLSQASPARALHPPLRLFLACKFRIPSGLEVDSEPSTAQSAEPFVHIADQPASPAGGADARGNHSRRDRRRHRVQRVAESKSRSAVRLRHHEAAPVGRRLTAPRGHRTSMNETQTGSPRAGLRGSSGECPHQCRCSIEWPCVRPLRQAHAHARARARVAPGPACCGLGQTALW